ncbi:hypothetical protein PE066_10240 [Ramlibacter tataouinensis]|uniref:hypothetical protein n=1 Tax=Ramlibacter tataouinensis TaxID=94132 RepID=UPI0022F3E15D|nr:hypothetical protein [Ramlibacter tataouinensis]WBY03873.1 hypothetical protein PE066_10240 [Ramlibacter tataouinensis]
MKPVERLSRQRLRSAAVVLPFLGAFLLLPPFLPLFTARVQVLGIPLIVVYLFGTWAALIALAWALAQRIGGEPEPPAG